MAKRKNISKLFHLADENPSNRFNSEFFSWPQFPVNRINVTFLRPELISHISPEFTLEIHNVDIFISIHNQIANSLFGSYRQILQVHVVLCLLFIQFLYFICWKFYFLPVYFPDSSLYVKDVMFMLPAWIITITKYQHRNVFYWSLTLINLINGGSLKWCF